MAKSALKARRIEAGENAIRAAVETAVGALHRGEHALAELGDMDEADAEDAA